ncbi:glycosyltransferase family 4 protein [candidate division CSSED10-310 bacterium]|uniref:Glycosyltransferase family 4 protein n=1 Tax=candidate division CSSED10-310 bacterium TaxID=2855610 RepID=A0ABV6YVL0_UNCC1
MASKKLVFLGYVMNTGLTLHFVDWLEALHAEVKDIFDITFITVQNEQSKGLYEDLTKIPVTTIIINKNDDLNTLSVFNEANIVHCHGMRQAIEVLRIRKKRSLSFKIIITLHAFRHGQWYRFLYTNLISPLLLNEIDLIHFVSQTAKNEFLQLNITYKKTNASVVFPLGCNQQRYSSEISIEHLEFYKELSRGSFNIIYLADLVPRKNHVWLIKVLRHFLINHDARLWLFGQGKQKQIVEKLVSDYKIEQYVYLPGRVDGKYIPSILQHMNIAVCISKSETMGHAIIEPLFAGIPVVTFDVGIASAVIRDFVTGFIVQNKSEIKNFQRALLFLINNKAKAEEMGKEARSFAFQRLSWKITAQNCFDAYQSLFS